MPFKLSTIVKKIDEIPNAKNRQTVKDFREYMRINGSSDNHQINNIKCIIFFAKYLGQDTEFTNISQREQILNFLNTKIKNQNEDPDKKWIGTWNNYLNRIRLFLRWLHNRSCMELQTSEWKTPEFLRIKILKTKRLSPYSENEIWEKDELLSVVKYEPHRRNKAILTLLWDLNARNHEISLLKLKHIRIREKYGEGEIPHEAKTGSGPILLCCSFPYVRDWLNEHPFKTEPEVRLICDLRTGDMIRPDAINDVMKLLRKRLIRLITDGEIKDEKERENLEFLLRTKKWNPYCIRHSSITSDSDYLPEYALKKKARWSMNSRQGARYIKTRMGNEMKNKILIQNGIISVEQAHQTPSIRNCSRCDVVNAVENEYCSKCSYPLTPSAFEQIKLEEDKKIMALHEKYEIEMKEMREHMDRQLGQIMSMIQQNPQLAQIKPGALSQKKLLK